MPLHPLCLPLEDTRACASGMNATCVHGGSPSAGSGQALVPIVKTRDIEMTTEMTKDL
jgi:hypothetical protein